MKKLISYIKLKRINPFLLLAAVILFIVSLSTITYSWVEGAASVTINSGTSAAISVSDTNKPIIIDTDSTETIDLGSYIDHNGNLFLSPAESGDGDTIRIMTEGSGGNPVFRSANTNDIGNNYIEFDFQAKVDYETEFKFKDSRIIVDGLGALKNPICLSFAVDNAAAGEIFKAEDITDGKTAFTLISGTHTVTARIWNQYSAETYAALKGKAVSFNLTLTPVQNTINLTFVDRTNDQNTLNSLTGKQLTVTCDGTESEKIAVSSTGNTTFPKLPQNKEITINAYSGSALISRWTLTTPKADTASYTAYGNLSASGGVGTFGEVVKLYFYDRSYSGVYNSQSSVSFSDGSNATLMYKNPTSAGEYSCYAPESNLSNGAMLYFNALDSSGSSKYYTPANADEEQISAQTVSFTLFGETEYIGDSGDIRCYGQWGNVNSDLITFRDRTQDRILTTDTNVTLKVACGQTADENNSYLADYIDGEWRMNVPKPSDINNERLVFTASDGTATYIWDNSDTANRTKTNDEYVYSATAADSDSEGTWQYRVSVTIADSPHANTTASYLSGKDVIMLNEGNTAEVCEGTQLMVKTIAAARVFDSDAIAYHAGELNGYRFVSFTASGDTFIPSAEVYDDYTNSYSQTITVGSSDMTVETNTAVQSYYLGGSGLKNITQWSDSVQMTYAPESNSVSATVEMTSSTAQIKISENGFTSAYRDNEAYSVTLNQPTVNIAEVSTVTSAALSGSGTDVVLEIEGSPNTEFTVNYALSTNTITVSGKAEEEPVGRVVYFDNSATKWTSVGAYMWGGVTNPDWNDTPTMTLVDGTTDIYYIEIDNDSYTNIIFRNLDGLGNENQTIDLVIPDIDDENKLFTITGEVTDDGNNKGKRTGSWSKYPPSVGDTISLKVGIIYYLYESNTPYSSWDYELEYSGGTTSGSVTLNQNHSPTNETAYQSVGSSYWSGVAQEFYIYTAEIPSDSTSVTLRITNGSTTHTFSPSPNPVQYNRLYGFEYGSSYRLYYENE